MMQLVLAALFFLGLHLGLAATSMSDRAVEKLGEQVYRAVFSVLALLGIFWLAYAYSSADYIETWGQPIWFKPIAAGLMLVALLLIVLGVTTANPTAVGGEKLLLADMDVKGVHRITRHPFLWGVALWALTHLLANGDVAALVLFGSRVGIARDAFD
jgi:uncharacterized membrane protein